MSHAFLIYLFGPVIALSFFNRTANATAIVILRTPNEIVAAADSMTTRSFGDKEIRHQSCKIRKVTKTLFFAYAGYYQSTDDVLALGRSISQSAAKHRSLPDILGASEEGIRVSLYEALDKQRTERPDYFKKNFFRSSRLNMIFFGVENDSTVVMSTQFRAFDAPPEGLWITLNRFRCPGHCDPVLASFRLADNTDVNKLWRSALSSGRNTLPALAEHFIELAIQANPKTIGPPVVVLGITKQGYSWVKGKDVCK